jgi:hypothetical protein
MIPVGLQEFLASQEGIYVYGPPIPVNQDLEATTRLTLAKYDIRVAIVDRSATGSGPVVKLFGEVLGKPTVIAGQFSLWTLSETSLAELTADRGSS